MGTNKEVLAHISPAARALGCCDWQVLVLVVGVGGWGCQWLPRQRKLPQGIVMGFSMAVPPQWPLSVCPLSSGVVTLLVLQIFIWTTCWGCNSTSLSSSLWRDTKENIAYFYDCGLLVSGWSFPGKVVWDQRKKGLFGLHRGISISNNGNRSTTKHKLLNKDYLTPNWPSGLLKMNQ